jgi:membrane fusion protein, multidrug efflux system
MTRHSVAFEIERPVPTAEAAKDLLPRPEAKTSASEPVAASVQPKKFNFRKMLMAGAAVVALAGSTWYGWDYWTVGQYQVSTDDAYVKADNTTIAPKVSGYLR